MTATAHPVPTVRRVTGWFGALTSTDHKRIGLNLGICSLAFFLLGGVFALLMRTQLAQPNMQFVSDNSYNELFTMHGSTMIYLFVTPMAIALALYLVPLQVGAISLSAPRVALSGFWIWLCGGLIMQSGWFTADGAGRAGWFSYIPLSNGTNTPGVGLDLWVIGVILAATGTILMAACVLATIGRRRAPGMSLLRMPVFTWTELVSMLMVVGAFPVLVLAMVLLFIDRHGGHIYTGFSGAIDYQDLFWFFGHPVVYVMFFPYLGAAAEAIAVSSHKRWFGYIAFVGSIMVFAALSMAVWSHHMFTTGGVTNQYFAFTSTALAGARRHRVLRHARHADRRFARDAHVDAVRAVLLHPVPDRRAERDLRRLAGPRLPRRGLLRDRRALPLHAVRRQHLRLLRRRLPLVPEGDRRAAAGVARQAAAGADGGRDEHDVLPDVLPRQRRDVAPDLPLPDPSRVGDAQPDRDDRRRDHRARRADVPVQRGRLAATACASRRRSMARTHARVGHVIAAAAAQFRAAAAADHLLRAAARPPPRGGGPRASAEGVTT